MITQFYTTTASGALMAQAMDENKQVVFTRGAIGTSHPASATDVQSLTNLVAHKYDMNVTKYTIAGQATSFGVDVVIDSNKVLEDTAMTEIGVFAQLGDDTSTEVLFLYGYSETAEDLKAGSTEVYRSDRIINTLIDTSTSIAVTVQSVVNPNVTVNGVADISGDIPLTASDIPTTNASVQSDLDTLKNATDTLTTDLTAIGTRTTDLETRVTTAEIKVEQNISDIADLKAKETNQFKVYRSVEELGLVMADLNAMTDVSEQVKTIAYALGDSAILITNVISGQDNTIPDLLVPKRGLSTDQTYGTFIMTNYIMPTSASGRTTLEFTLQTNSTIGEQNNQHVVSYRGYLWQDTFSGWDALASNREDTLWSGSEQISMASEFTLSAPVRNYRYMDVFFNGHTALPYQRFRTDASNYRVGSLDLVDDAGNPNVTTAEIMFTPSSDNLTLTMGLNKSVQIVYTGTGAEVIANDDTDVWVVSKIVGVR